MQSKLQLEPERPGNVPCYCVCGMLGGYIVFVVCILCVYTLLLIFDAQNVSL